MPGLRRGKRTPIGKSTCGVKLLFDANLSPRLLGCLSAAFPGSGHVELKDNDFRQLSFLKGLPPKVIWLSIGNAGTQAIATLLKNRRARIEAFQANTDEALLVLEEAGA